MDIKELFKKMDANYIDTNSCHLEENGISILVTNHTLNKMLNIELRCDLRCKSSPQRQAFINGVSKANGFNATFALDKKTLVMKSVMWIDKKPTKDNLYDLISSMEATLISVKTSLENLEERCK